MLTIFRPKETLMRPLVLWILGVHDDLNADNCFPVSTMSLAFSGSVSLRIARSMLQLCVSMATLSLSWNWKKLKYQEPYSQETRYMTHDSIKQQLKTTSFSKQVLSTSYILSCFVLEEEHRNYRFSIISFINVYMWNYICYYYTFII